MKSKSLVACLAILGCVSVTSLPIQAADAPEQKIAPSRDNAHELEVGSRIPEQFRRPGNSLNNWKQLGLKEPSKESEWVKVQDKYVMMQKTNGQIVEIVPIKK